MHKQGEILDELMKGKSFCNTEATEMFNMTRAAVNNKLLKLERGINGVKSRYKNKQVGDRTFAVKYYYWDKPNKN